MFQLVKVLHNSGSAISNTGAPLYLSGGEAGTGGYNGDVYIRNGTTESYAF